MPAMTLSECLLLFPCRVCPPSGGCLAPALAHPQPRQGDRQKLKTVWQLPHLSAFKIKDMDSPPLFVCISSTYSIRASISLDPRGVSKMLVSTTPFNKEGATLGESR